MNEISFGGQNNHERQETSTCPGCGNSSFQADNYCGKCGIRLGKEQTQKVEDQEINDLLIRVEKNFENLNKKFKEVSSENIVILWNDLKSKMEGLTKEQQDFMVWFAGYKEVIEYLYSVKSATEEERSQHKDKILKRLQEYLDMLAF